MKRVQQFLQTRAAARAPARSQHEAALEQEAEAAGRMPPTIAPRDFARVRIHDDAEAHECADAFGARAFTCGRDVYFGSGQLAPQTADGRELIGHEMAHVAQQADQGAALQFDPKKARAGIGAMPPEDYFIKDADNWGVEDEFVLFDQDEATLDGGDEKTIRDFAAKQQEAVQVFVHAYASREGPDEYNLNLSAHRGVAVKKFLEGLLPPKSEVTIFAHGQSKHFGATPKNRRVGLSLVGPVEPTGFRLKIDFPPRHPLRFRPRPYDPPPILDFPPHVTFDPSKEPPPWTRPLPLGPRPGIDWLTLRGLYGARGLPMTDRDARGIEEEWNRSSRLLDQLGIRDDFKLWFITKEWILNKGLSRQVEDVQARDNPNAMDRAQKEWKTAHPDAIETPIIPIFDLDWFRKKKK